MRWVMVWMLVTGPLYERLVETAGGPAMVPALAGAVVTSPSANPRRRRRPPRPLTWIDGVSPATGRGRAGGDGCGGCLGCGCLMLVLAVGMIMGVILSRA